MFIALSFVGPLPSYVVDCIHQVRIYFDGDVHLIIDDVESVYVEQLKKYNVIIENARELENEEFNQLVGEVYHKFYICEQLKGREKLFILSFGRFFLLNNLMNKKGLTDGLFIELDNLLYDDPKKWLPSFSTHDLCFMYHNHTACSSGIMYVKNKDSLRGFLDYIFNYLRHSNDFLSEMAALYQYYKLHENDGQHIQILPTYWPSVDGDLPPLTHLNYEKYDNTVFDTASFGIYLLGMDPYHTNGEIVLGLVRKEWYFLDSSKLTFEWKVDDAGRKKPYVWNGESWLLINNLHVHSKQLTNGLSLALSTGNSG
jgi:hypothetical protein